jgi:hypothetical protein
MSWLFWTIAIICIMIGVYVGLRFFSHPIARDRVLMAFKLRYWVGLAFVFFACWGGTALACLCKMQKEPARVIEHYCSADNYKSHYGKIVSESLKHLADKKMDDDEGAGYFMWVILAHSVIFSGLLISGIVGWTDRRSTRCAAGMVRYKQRHLNGWLVALLDGKFPKKHQYAVVVGANEVASSVIKHLLDKGNRYVILQTSSNIDQVRQVLQSHLTEAECKKVIIYSALRDSLEEIKALHLAQASEIYILGENTVLENGETYHDAMNMRCLNLMAEVLKNDEKRNGPKICHVLFEYQTTYSVFQHSDISQDIKDVIDFMPFNRYESWARRVMVDNVAIDLVDREDGAGKMQGQASISLREQIDYMPLDGYEGIAPEDEKHVHFIVVGMSKMGVAMATQAMHLAHFPNTYKYPNQRTRITFIDANADKEMLFFKGRYTTLFELVRQRYLDASQYLDRDTIQSEYGWRDPMEDYNSPWKHLGTDGKNFMDVEVEFIKGELQSPSVGEYLRTVLDDETAKVTIAVCLPYTHEAIAASLYMPREVYVKKQLQQIWVYQREASDIISNLTGNRTENQFDLYKKLRPFGMVYGEYMDNESHLIKAQLVNAKYNEDIVYLPAVFGVKTEEEQEAEEKNNCEIFKEWNKLSVAKKWSNRLVADSIYLRIRSIDGVPIVNTFNKIGVEEDIAKKVKKYLDDKFEFYKDELAVCEHHRWNVEQLMMGYIPCNKQQFDEFLGWVCKGDMNSHRVKRGGLKKPNSKIHLDICGMDAKGKPLNDVDPGIGNTDIKLNNAIPHIALLVDGYKHVSRKEMVSVMNIFTNIQELNRRIISRITQQK